LGRNTKINQDSFFVNKQQSFEIKGEQMKIKKNTLLITSICMLNPLLALMLTFFLRRWGIILISFFFGLINYWRLPMYDYYQYYVQYLISDKSIFFGKLISKNDVIPTFIFWLAKILGLPFGVVGFTLSFLGCILFLSVMKKEFSRNRSNLLIFYIAIFSLPILTFRATLAYAFFFMFFYFDYKEKKRQKFVFLILACMTHYSILIFYVFYVLGKVMSKRGTKYSVVIMIWISGAISAPLCINLLYKVTPSNSMIHIKLRDYFFGYYGSSFLSTMSIKGLIALVIGFGFQAILIYFCYYKIQKSDRKYIYGFILFAPIFITFITFFSRYMNCYLLLIVFLICKQFEKGIVNIKILQITLCLLLIIFMFSIYGSRVVIFKSEIVKKSITPICFSFSPYYTSNEIKSNVTIDGRMLTNE